jgi:hypothetical protein
VDGYHADLDRATGAKAKGSEMITEIYVQRPQLAAFMEDARAALRRRRANVIYGTVRMIEKRRRDISGMGARAVRVRLRRCGSSSR